MPIISRVGARSRKGRAVHAVILLALTAGAFTMLYPFVVMISGALCSEMDESELALVPRYLYDRDVLYRKFLEAKYNQNISESNKSHLRQDYGFRDASLPDEIVERRVRDFRRFAEQTEIPTYWQGLGFVHGIRNLPKNLRQLQNRLAMKFNGDLNALGHDLGTPVSGWSAITLPPVNWLSQRFDYQPNAIFDAYFQLLRESDLAERRMMSLKGEFLESMIFPAYGRTNTDAYNINHQQPIARFSDLLLPQVVPLDDQPKLRGEWVAFVRNELNPSFILLKDVPVRQYQQFLQEKYVDIISLNRSWSSDIEAFSAIELPARRWLRGSERADYHEFVLVQQPERYWLDGPEFAWRDWLKNTYGSLDAVNLAHRTSYRSFDQVRMPMDELEYEYVIQRPTALRWSFATQNFITVFRELVIQGSVLRNTAFLCALSVLFALLINPLAAYAMSRFALPGTYKILLFLMATMAFPPMVTLIPTFIMLREIHWLNTFAALTIPFIANGYLIFLLKGFFDSLPRELYEAGTIDGASEIRMFFQITMALSKPILAVVALDAFNAAYTMFLYALIVCPREDMWLLSVWLFQFQSRSSTAAMFASVLIACVPTLIIFVLAQNIIMRGIVVPTEKG